MAKVFNMCGGGQEVPQITVSSDGLITATANGLSSSEQLSRIGSATITPTTETMNVVTPGKFTTGYINVEGDSNLIPANIKNGVTIFDVEGTYTGCTIIQGSTNSIIDSLYVDGNSIHIGFNTSQVSVPTDQTLKCACITIDLAVDFESSTVKRIIIFPENPFLTGERALIMLDERGFSWGNVTMNTGNRGIIITHSGLEFTDVSGVDDASYLVFS